MNTLGTLLFATIAFLIDRRYHSAERLCAFPRYGSIGAGILIGAQILAIYGVVPVGTYFTAIAWTGYILWADAAVFALKGRSLLRTYPAEFAWIALLSIPLWLIFEAYNLRLENWIYVGLPSNRLARGIGYAWAFATIWPGVFETATLLGGLYSSRDPERAIASGNQETPREQSGLSSVALWSVVAGALMLTLPIVLPRGIRQIGRASCRERV